jgi:hypothetical protein
MLRAVADADDVRLLRKMPLVGRQLGHDRLLLRREVIAPLEIEKKGIGHRSIR